LPECKSVTDGWSQADSIVVNPHKMLFVPFDFSALYLRDLERLRRLFTLVPEYLHLRDPVGPEINYMDYGVQLGRRFRSLKLWFVIRHYGIEGLQHHIREHVRLAQQFAAGVRDDSRFELAAPAQLNLVCFRLRATDRADQDRTDQDQANQLLMERLNRSGDLYLTHTKLDGKLTLRFCVGQTNTQARHVERTWRRIQEETGKLGNS